MSIENVPNGLVQYEHMRVAVQQCATVDVAKDIRDKAEALAFYARQRDDLQLEVWTSEIRLRAIRRIGEISRGLDKAEANGRGPVSLPNGGKRKAETLADAGLSTSTAQRYEALTGGATALGQQAAEAATERFFAQARANGTPATIEGLRGAIRAALVETLGEPPPRRAIAKRTKADPDDEVFGIFCASLRSIAEVRENALAGFADAALPRLIGWHLDHAQQALPRITQFIGGLERRAKDAAK